MNDPRGSQRSGRYVDDPSDPVVSSGLRALREEGPTDDSRRAALTALGLGPDDDNAAERVDLSGGQTTTFVRWCAAAMAISVAVLLLVRWLLA
jgi:hypothetical protein